MGECWGDLAGKDVLRTRRVLRVLLEEPLRFTPVDEGEQRRRYRFEGTVTFGETLAGNVDVLRACNKTKFLIESESPSGLSGSLFTSSIPPSSSTRP